MAVTVAGSGSQVCTVTTEHTLITVTAEGVYVLYVDLTAAVAGDVFELRAKKSVLTSGTVVTHLYAMFSGVQPTEDKLKQSIPAVHDGVATSSLVWTIKQTFGTSRTIPWSLNKL